MKSIEAEGGCMCGRIRYKLTCKPIYATMCHCSDCRRACGAQAVAWVTVPGKHFSFTKGDPQRYQSSAKVERTFCPTCGTSLTYRNEERDDEMDITTGSLDHPEQFPPTQDYYCRDRLAWVQPTTGKLKE
ncbi:MAG: GFA family protein [Planctomycetota bacterium]|nr:MAG: GFA family protein [Planctomycetota bacterium]